MDRGRPSAPSRPAKVGPLSLERVVVYLLSALLAYSIVAAFLMSARFFRPVPMLVGTAVLAALLVHRWVRAVPREAPPRRLAGQAWSLRVALAVLLAVSAVSGLVFSSEHVETDRDPGVYVNAGRWLADHGTVSVKPDVEGFQEAEPGSSDDDRMLFFPAAGYYNFGHRFGIPPDQIYPRFFHTLSAVLAGGAWVGGSWLLVRMNAVLGAVALLMVFAFAARLMRPWLALAATAALGVNLTQVYFQRDAYTEILTQAFLFGGLWALWEASRHLRADRGVVAGLLLGATCLVRVDSFLFLVPIAAALVVYLVRSADRSPGRHPRRRRFVFAVGLGMASTSFLGLAQGLLLSPPYVTGFGRELVVIGAGLLLTVVVGGVVLRYRARFSRVRRLYRKHRRLFALAAAVLVLGVPVVIYVRPVLFLPDGDPWRTVVDGFRAEESAIPRGTRRDFSMWWLGWYLGPVGLAAGVAGWARGWWSTLSGRESRMLPFLFVFSLTTVLYLWTPRISPDHVWAMRRFLPITIPGFFVLGFWMVDRLWAGLRGRGPGWRAVPAVVAAGTLAFSSWTLASVPAARAQRTLDATERLCERLPEGSGVLVAHDGQFFLRFTQTVRGFCGTPAAFVSRELSLEEYRGLADRWEARGGRLYVLSPERVPFDFRGTGLEGEHVASVAYERLRRTPLSRPSSPQVIEFDLYLVPLSAASEGTR